MSDKAIDDKFDYDKAVPLMEALQEMGVAIIMITPNDVRRACDNNISYDEADERLNEHLQWIEGAMEDAAQTYIANEMTRIN